MLKRTSLSRRMVHIALFLALLSLVAGGCSKPLAELSLKSARRKVQQARSDEAEKYNPDKLKDVEQQIESAQNQINQSQYDLARESAGAAKEQAEQLAENTKTQRAQALKAQATEDVNVARINQGQQLNETLFNEIVDLNNQAEEALNKTKYEKTIDLCLAIHDKVAALLQQIRNEAEEKLMQRKNEFDTLLREGGRAEAAKYVTEAQKKIADVENLIEKDRNYRLAIQKCEELKILIADGITEAFRNRAKKKIDMLESKQTRAILEGAEKYNSEFLASCQEQYRVIVANFYSDKFEQVLEAADLLEPRLDRLILETRILAAKDAMDQVRKAIRGLEADQVRKYLKGELEKVEKLLEKAEGEFKQDLYDDCKKTCQIALEERDHIIKKFDALAAQEIRAASGKVTEAEALLDRMAEIFAVQSPPSDIAYEQAFENTKQTFKTVLDNIAREAAVLVGAAGVNKEDKQFSEAVENARLAASKCDYVVREVFHVVAHNNVLELARRISQVENNGGARFAAKELAAAKAELKRARDMIRKQEQEHEKEGAKIDPQAYRQAVTQTSEAKATVETVIQEIVKEAEARLRQAEVAIEKAESDQAANYALGELTTARSVLEQGRQSFAARQWFQAAQQAEQAERVAFEARHKALRAWAGSELAAARSAFEGAKEAQAAQYATQMFQQAGDKLATAQDLFDQSASMSPGAKAVEALAASRELAVEARKDAEAARKMPITEANQAIVTAKRFGAWQYDYVTVMNAIISARKALEAMEAGQFAISQAYAQKAEQEARFAARTAKQSSYAERMQEVNERMGQVADAGGSFYNPQAMQALASELNHIRRNYSPERYETVMAQVAELERNLFQVAKATPDVFGKLHTSRVAFYDDLKLKGATDFARERMRRAERLLRFSRADFDNGRFADSYSNLIEASQVLVSIQMEYDEFTFTTQVRHLLARLMEEKKQIDPLLDINRATLGKLVMLPNARNSMGAMLAGASPVEFREGVDELYKRTLSTEPPQTMTAEYEHLKKVMLIARKAAMQFEKLIILDHYDEETASEIMSEAFDLMAQCMGEKNELSKRFERKGLQGDLATLEHVIGN